MFNLVFGHFFLLPGVAVAPGRWRRQRDIGSPSVPSQVGGLGFIYLFI